MITLSVSKQKLMCLFSLLFLGCFVSGCVSFYPPDSIREGGVSLVSLENIQSNTPEHMRDSHSSGKAKLCIDADIVLPQSKQFPRISLVRDTDAAQRLSAALIPKSQEDIVQIGKWDWTVGDAGASFEVDDWWMAAYINPVKDPTGREYQSYEYDSESDHEFGFFTTHIPHQMKDTAAQAGKRVCDFLQPYSAFTFQTYRVKATDSQTDTAESGFYRIYAQCLYNAIPICPVSTNTRIAPLYISADVTQNHIFDLSGSFLWTAAKEEAVQEFLPLDAAISHLKESLSAFTDQNLLTINHISLEYVAEANQDGSYVLTPAWVFYGYLHVTESPNVDYRIGKAIVFSAEKDLLYGDFTLI